MLTHHICCSQAGGGVQTSLRGCPGPGHPQQFKHITHCVSVTQQPQGVTQEVSRFPQPHVSYNMAAA